MLVAYHKRNNMSEVMKVKGGVKRRTCCWRGDGAKNVVKVRKYGTLISQYERTRFCGIKIERVTCRKVLIACMN
jgi:hypothetical protein